MLMLKNKLVSMRMTPAQGVLSFITNYVLSQNSMSL